jgi:hypothetical protein
MNVGVSSSNLVTENIGVSHEQVMIHLKEVWKPQHFLYLRLGVSFLVFVNLIINN